MGPRQRYTVPIVLLLATGCGDAARQPERGTAAAAESPAPESPPPRP